MVAFYRRLWQDYSDWYKRAVFGEMVRKKLAKLLLLTPSRSCHNMYFRVSWYDQDIMIGWLDDIHDFKTLSCNGILIFWSIYSTIWGGSWFKDQVCLRTLVYSKIEHHSELMTKILKNSICLMGKYSWEEQRQALNNSSLFLHSLLCDVISDILWWIFFITATGS